MFSNRLLINWLLIKKCVYNCGWMGGGVKSFRRCKGGGVSELRLPPTRGRAGQKLLVFFRRHKCMTPVLIDILAYSERSRN